jgi:hypothetical protein
VRFPSRLDVLALGLVVIPVASGQGPWPQCSLDWTEVREHFGAEHDWPAATEPLLLYLEQQEDPTYVAQVFASREGKRTALIVAEWGAPDSSRLGAVVYCTVRDAADRVLDEVGVNPCAEKPEGPPLCRQWPRH